MVETYWHIGRRIFEQEQHGRERANYGDHLLVNLSRYLSDTLGKGFSVANLWNFRQFYLIWPSDGFLYTLCREMSWSHLRLIMRLDSEKSREYYLNETRAQGWSVRIDLKTQKLTHQDIGQIDMYVRMFDDLKRGPDDNPTIGIILCADKEETVVKYSVLSDNRQLFASKYKLILPTEEELTAELERNIRYLREEGKAED